MRRNLVLVHDPGYQSLDDLEEICRRVETLDETIATHIAFNTLENGRTNRRTDADPTLVVSFTQLKRYQPARGRILQGRWIAKTDQIEALLALGVPAPKTRLLTPGFNADPREWGEIVLIKPALPVSTFGRDVTLVRTANLASHVPDDDPESLKRRAPLLMQEFIDTGRLPSQYRVLTLLGVPLYCRKLVRDAGEVHTDVDDSALERMPVATVADPRVHSQRCDEPDILSLASRAAAAFPDIPLQGMDILREAATGRLFVIELNPGGNTWHFSSQLGLPIKQGIGRMLGASEADAESVGRTEMTSQFDALARAARALAERTRRDAL